MIGSGLSHRAAATSYRVPRGKQALVSCACIAWAVSQERAATTLYWDLGIPRGKRASTVIGSKRKPE
jgi:hypothetical protein